VVERGKVGPGPSARCELWASDVDDFVVLPRPSVVDNPTEKLALVNDACRRVLEHLRDRILFLD
jgi:hypothetical protein